MNATHTVTPKSLRRHLAALLLLVTLGLAATHTAQAQVPQRLAYQSLITDKSGDLAPDGSYRVTFRLYDSPTDAGQPLWSETQTLTASQGLFSAMIGQEKALDLPFDKPYYLSVQIGDEPETQRLALSTAAYALMAQDVPDHTVVRSISGIQDEVDLIAGDGIKIEQHDNRLVISAQPTTTQPTTTEGYGPEEAAFAVHGTLDPFKANKSDAWHQGLSLSEEEDHALIAQILATLGDGGSNTGLDAAYDAGRVVTLDDGQVLLDGPGGATVGLQVRNADMLFRNSTGAQTAFRFMVDGAAQEQVWAMSLQPNGLLVFTNTTGLSNPFILHKSAQNNLLLLEDSALKVRNAAGEVKVQIDSDVDGDGRVITEELEITGGSDLAESFDISGAHGVEQAQPGMVVSIDPDRPTELRISGEAYDRMVAGVVSGAGGIETGLLMGQRGSEADGSYPVALTGRVYVWVDAAYGSVRPGDLLTSSETAGHAMKVGDHGRAQGAILGKAMTSLDEDRGLVLMLVSLQ